MKILVFQTAFLGDLILTSPLLKSLKKSFKEAEVALVVRKGFESVFNGAWFVDKVISFDKKGVYRFSRRIGGYDIAISPHRSHRTSLVLWLSRIKRRIGFDIAGFSFLYTDRVSYVRKRGVHEVDRNLSLLKPLEGEFNLIYDSSPELPVTDEEVNGGIKKFSLKTPYVVVAPGSVWATKRWLPEYYSEVCDYLKGTGFEVVLVGSVSERDVCEAVAKGMTDVKNLCGRTSLREFFAIVKGAELVVSNDSSPVHVAVSVKTPVVEIYGATVPEFGFFPYGKGEIVELEGLPCRPCGIHGGNRCPERHFRCMKDLKPEMVIEKIKKFL